MNLSDLDIRAALDGEGLVIEPLYEPIQPASVDLCLGPVLHRFLLFPGMGSFDPMNGGSPVMEKLDINPVDGYPLDPDEFVNVSTLEWIEIPAHLIGLLVGKSSFARIGLQVECAGFVDPKYKGRPTLELKNLGPRTIILRVAMPIAQLRLQRMLNTPSRGYGDPELGSHYQFGDEPEPGKFTRRPDLLPG